MNFRVCARLTYCHHGTYKLAEPLLGVRPMTSSRASLGLLLALILPACGSDNPYEGQLSSATTQLRRYDSCSALETDLKEILIAEVRAEYDQQRYWQRNGGGIFGGAEDATGAPAPSESPQTPRTPGEDFSTTNNQEHGVDEADFVKTDGYSIYVLNGNRLHIFGVPQFGQLVPASVREIEGWPREMLVDYAAKKLVVFSGVDAYTLPPGHPIRAKVEREAEDGDRFYWRIANLSKLTVFDVSNPAEPRLVRELYLEGFYSTARLVDSTVRMAAYTYLTFPYYGWWWNDPDIDVQEKRSIEAIRRMALTDLVPMIYERHPSGEVAEHPLTGERCASFLRPSDSHARGVTSILSLDLLSDDRLAIDADQVLSNWSTLYASTDHLAIAEAAHDWWWFWWSPDDEEKTNIHVFDTTRPGKAVYVGSGRVPGMIRDQFSLSDHEGHLRVATTLNRFAWWWQPRPANTAPPPPENELYVLSIQAGLMPIVGAITGIAQGETIQSVRFDGDRGYLTTFRRIDPFFTLDLADPRRPKIIGELKIPGFATYIHPIADQKVLTIGFGGDETGTNWRTQVSMLDVTNFADPMLVKSLDLAAEGGWAWSEATYEHKAFQYWAPKKLLALPVSTWQSGYNANGTWWYRYFSRLELVRVDTSGVLERFGYVDHSDFFNSDQTYQWSPDVRRSIFMGDFLYAISDRGITVNRTDTLAPVLRQALPGSRYGEWWWWY